MVPTSNNLSKLAKTKKKNGVNSHYSLRDHGQGQGVLCFVNMLSLSIRCPKCHGCVETRPCSNRSKENAHSAWKSAPDNIHNFRNCWKGPHRPTGARTGTKIRIRASKTIYQPSRAGRKTTGPKRSVLPPTLRRQPCSGTQPSDTEDTFTVPSHFILHSPTPTFYCSVLILRCHSRGIRTADKSTKGGSIC